MQSSQEMQVSLEIISGLERRLTFVVPAENVDSKVEAHLQKLARSVHLDGFRPGKVPYKMVKIRYGKSARRKIVHEIIDEAYRDAIEKQSLKPAGAPTKVEPTLDTEGQDFSFVVELEVLPEIQLTDYSGSTFSEPKVEIVEQDVLDMIEKLREQHKFFEPTKEAAKPKDKLKISFQGVVDGEPLEGGSSEDYELELGSKSMIDGFESGLEGAKLGEERILNLKFPANYQNEALRGKEVHFTVQIKQVSTPKLPEVNEAFYNKFRVDQNETFDEASFKDEVKRRMTIELTRAIKKKMKDQVMDRLLEINSVEVPRVLLTQEIDTMKRDMFARITQGNSEIKYDPKMLQDSLFEKEASRRVRLGLILMQIIKDKAVSLDEKRLNAKLEELAQSYDNPNEVISWYKSNKEALEQVKGVVLEDQLVDAVLEVSEINDTVFSYKDFMDKGRYPEQKADSKQEANEKEAPKERVS